METNYGEQTKLVGELFKIIYEAPESNFKILRIRTKDQKIITIKGYMILDQGIMYNFIGRWVAEKKYGDQVLVEDYFPFKDFAMNEKNIINYLSSRLFDGIGKSTAKRIFDKFGADSLKIVEDEPEKLVAIKGITAKKVEQIKKSFQRNSKYRALTIRLSKEDVTPNMIDKIYDKYGFDSVRIIDEQPYRLAYDIDGFGFKTADRIALASDDKMVRSSQRIQAGIFFAIKDFCTSTGNLYIEVDNLINKTKDLLDNKKAEVYISIKEIENAIINLCKDKKLIMRENYFALAKYYYEERICVESLGDLLRTKGQNDFPIEKIKRELEKVEKEENIHYSEGQKKAIINSLSTNVSIITGGPGTGKSTIVNAIIKIFSKLAVDTAYIRLSAPTGKASKRMQEVTGEDACTIHRLLEFNPAEGGFKFGKKNKLTCNMVIVDEFSMVDISLFKALITSIPVETCKVIFVGDVNQLASVGPGAVLKDLIDSEYVPTTKLTDIFRQAQTSKIIINASTINKGTGKLEVGNDFKVIKLKEDITETQIQEIILKEYRSCIDNFRTVQVLCPLRNKARMISSDSLNPILSQIANPDNQDKVILQKSETKYHMNDKVMQIKNNYEKEVFNGEVGEIIDYSIKDKGKVAYVDYDDDRGEIEYVSAEELDLAYATTIHKSQGSEYDVVIIPIIRQNTFMLEKNLIYTAVTRAKKKCILIMHVGAFVNGIHKDHGIQRKTFMANDLRIYKNKGELNDYAHFSEKQISQIINGEFEQ